MSTSINRTVLMSGADFFDDNSPINPYMDRRIPVDRQKAQAEHAAIRAALEQAGITVHKIKPPVDCQDGVYTANWALGRGDTAVLAHLPNARENEQPAAEQALQNIGKTIVHVPDGLRFSGQGDALPCGNYLFAGQGYRSDAEAQAFAAKTLGYELIQLQTIPQLDKQGTPVINQSSGWPDSFFYDIDLALSILRAPNSDQPGLIAWCPEAFTPESQAILRAFNKVEKIEISLAETQQAFACNLVSTGETVIMSGNAPIFKAALEARGMRVISPDVQELLKGGGFIRCTTLTLDNE
jgi:N-dimethylarginine dimethylaminohydrolase